MKFKITTLAALIFVFTGCLFDRSPSRNSVLIVNEHKLSLDEFANDLAQKLKEFDALSAKNPEVIRTAKESIISEFINDALVTDWANKNNVSVTDEELSTAINVFRKQYPDDLTMKEVLRSQGISFEKWSDKLRAILLQKKAIASLQNKIPPPTPAELKSYFDSHKDMFSQKAMIRLRQIVLDKPDEAERMLNQINKNTDLSSLARQFSIAPDAKNGGDTGWIPKGTLEIFDKAFEWPVGKRSAVLKSPYGFHIFEVIGKKPESQLKFEEAQDTIRRLMMADREQAVFSAWLEDQVKSAVVLRNDELIQSVSVATKGEM